jgi:lysophospholipase L1-like esterase
MMNASEGFKPEKLDEYMRERNVPDEDGIVWHSPNRPPFRLCGFAWFSRDGKYRRLPAEPDYPIRPAVDSLADCTAGGQIRFRTDARTIAIRAELSGSNSMYHMAPTGQCGFDCYLAKPGETWLYAGTARVALGETRIEHRFLDAPDLHGELKDVLINFPLYQGVQIVEIGLNEGAAVEETASIREKRKVIMYGTSITQGGCASRPGLLPTNVWSRRFPFEFINLGFSGNGKGEAEIARIIAQIEDPALLILDYVSNAESLEKYAATLPAFVRIYRERHAGVPILILSRIPYAADRHDARSRHLRERYRDIGREVTERLRLAGDRRIFFYDGTDLLGEDFEECTVDGTHPTDLGFMRIADKLTPILADLLLAEVQCGQDFHALK